MEHVAGVRTPCALPSLCLWIVFEGGGRIGSEGPARTAPLRIRVLPGESQTGFPTLHVHNYCTLAASNQNNLALVCTSSAAGHQEDQHCNPETNGCE